MNDKIRYISFPIVLFREEDITQVCNNAFNFWIYSHANTYRKNEGAYKHVRLEHIEKAMGYYGLSGNNGDILQWGYELYNSFTDKEVVTSVNMNILVQYLKGGKTLFQIEQFRAYCAFRSIIGKKSWCNSNKANVTARMYGYGTVKEFINNGGQELNRYKWDKTVQELRIGWKLKYYGYYTRGFYFSFDLPIDELAVIAESKKVSNKKKRLSDETKQAREKALSKLNKPP